MTLYTVTDQHGDIIIFFTSIYGCSGYKQVENSNCFLLSLQSLEQSKNCVEEENDGDVLKQENQDLAGLLSSPETKSRDNGTPSGIKAELNSANNADIKEEVKEEISIKNEPSNPGSVGKMPNGDATTGL